MRHLPTSKYGQKVDSGGVPAQRILLELVFLN